MALVDCFDGSTEDFNVEWEGPGVAPLIPQSNLVLWIAGDDLTGDTDSLINSWPDRSPAARTVLGIGEPAGKPIVAIGDGLPYKHAFTDNALLTTSTGFSFNNYALENGFTLIMLVKQTSAPQTAYFGGGSQFLLDQLANGRFQFQMQFAANQSDVFSAYTGWRIVTLRMQKGATLSTVAFWDDLTAKGSGTTTNPTVPVYASRFAQAGFAQLSLAELIVYNTPLSTLYRQGIANYLRHKWGL